MHATHDDVREGKRTDLTVEFVSRRSLDADGTRVQRLLVSDRDGERFAVLVAPDTGLLPGLKTGETYGVSDLLGCRPVPDPAPDAPDCPDCGATLRPGGAVDAVDPALAAAAAELGLDDRFGVVDETTTVGRAGGGDAGIDDWRPMGDARPESVEAPDYVCTGCDRTLDAADLRRETPPAIDLDSEPAVTHAVTPSAEAPGAETVGLAAGGATDVTNFRENVESGFTPRPEAVADEGLFSDYHFETGSGADADALFAPRYAAAASEHPVTGETERFLSVGLDSTLSRDDFERPPLELVVALDVSGSMNSPFDDYYHDEQGRRREVETGGQTKLAAATASLCALTERLDDDDRLGVVLYDHRAHVAKPLRDVGATDMDAVRRHVRDVSAGGGTNLADGFEAAADLLRGGDADAERRVLFMTDMMPDTGTTDEEALVDLFADAAETGIHTTFVGMGLDENPELADALSGVRGANHYFVRSADEFERRLGRDLGYAVTPLVFDLRLELDADGYEVRRVHGAPNASDASAPLVHVETLFPSPTRGGEVRGGVVLVEVEQTAPDADLSLVASWTERDGTDRRERVAVEVPDAPESFEHDGVRKAVALARYARSLRSWAHDVHARADATHGVDDWLLPDQRGEHEHDSVPLAVPAAHADRFETLRDYLRAEMDAVGDETLRREVDLLATLCRTASRPKGEAVDG
jgi:Ca-activated chloride channel family protein